MIRTQAGERPSSAADDPGRGTPAAAWPVSVEVGVLVSILALAGLVRSLAWARTTALFNDGPLFLYLAEAVQKGDWAAVLAHPYHPLYPIAIALFAGGDGDLEQAAAWLSILSGVVSVGALYAFVRAAFDARIAWLAALLLAVHPYAVDFTCDVQSDGLHLAFFLIGVAALYRGLAHARPGWLFAAGLASGLAYLVRPEGVAVVVVGCVLIGGLVVTRRWSWIRSIPLVLTLSVGLLAPMSPYLVALAHQTGELTLTKKKTLDGLPIDLPTSPGAAGENASGDPEPSASLAPEPTRIPERIPTPWPSPRIDSSNDRAPDHTPKGFFSAIARVLETGISALRLDFVLLAVVGLIAIGRRPGFREVYVAAYPAVLGVVLVWLVFSAGYVSRRHALTAVVPLLGHAAAGLAALAAAIAARGSQGRAGSGRALRAGCLAAAVLVVLAVTLPRDLRVRRGDRRAVVEAARWLEEARSPTEPVAAQKLRIAYYAGAPYVPLPSGLDEPLIGFLRRAHVKYVIVDDDKVGDHRGLREAQTREMRFLHRQLDGDHSASVWELLPEPAQGQTQADG